MPSQSSDINYEPSWKSSGNIAPCVFVTIDPGFDEQVLQSVVGDMPIGVMWDGMQAPPGVAGSDNTIAATSGAYGFRVVGLGNDTIIQLAGTVSPGNVLKPNGSGQAISGTVGDRYGAVALQAGTSGQRIRCLVMRGVA